MHDLPRFQFSVSSCRLSVLLGAVLLLAGLPVVSLRCHATDYRPIISAAELHEQIRDPQLVVLDIRSREAFSEGHITGSRWIDSDAWRGKTFEETGLHDKPYWETTVRQAGLTRTQRIVVVGEALPEIARVWWLLRYLGLPHVRVLDGGFAAWQRADLPTVMGEPGEVAPSDSDIEFQPQMLAVVDDLLPAALKNGKVRVLDNRSDGEYTGSRGIGTRTGHVPGSIHFEWKRFLGADGKFLPVEDICELLKKEGIDTEEPIVALCQSAGRSSVAALALELAGARKVRNYYRGWGDYAATLTAPVEKGATPEAVDQ
jgi:thiosulfate/3-mercaptopyruvate sulfurtransferase